jgi:hypothetical protein
MVIALIGGTLLLLQVPLAVAWRGSIPDESRQTVAREWLTALVDRLPPDAVVVSWWGYSTTLWYGQFAEGLRPDVTVIDDSTIVQRGLGSASAVIDSYLGQRPVFLIRLSSDLPAFQRRYLLSLVPGVSGGDVYRVEERLATAGREPIIGRWP